MVASGLLVRAVALVGLEDAVGVGLPLELAMALGSAGDLAGPRRRFQQANLSAMAKDLIR